MSYQRYSYEVNSVVPRPKYKGPFSMDCREQGSRARGVYPTQDTSRMGTARVKQEEEADTRIMQESSKISGRNNPSNKDK